MSVETLAEDPRWQAAGLAGLAERACGAALAGLGLDPARFEIGLLGCDDARIAELNAGFRGRNAPTNVLSWPAVERRPGVPGAVPAPPEGGLPGAPEALGDVAIAWETCRREASEAGRAFEFHVAHLLVHATLHLLGYDHIDARDAALMEEREREILASLGFPDPYEGMTGERAGQAERNDGRR